MIDFLLMNEYSPPKIRKEWGMRQSSIYQRFDLWTNGANIKAWKKLDDASRERREAKESVLSFYLHRSESLKDGLLVAV